MTSPLASRTLTLPAASGTVATSPVTATVCMGADVVLVPVAAAAVWATASVPAPTTASAADTANTTASFEVSPDGRIVWSIDQKELPGITLAWVTMLEVLPNGNVIIGNCHASKDNPQLIEVTRDKRVVWTFHNFKVFGNATAASQVLGIERNLIR